MYNKSKIKMYGDVIVTNNNKLIDGCKNHLINNGFIGIFNILFNYNYVSQGGYNYLPANSWYIHLGTDTTTITDPTMTELMSLIAVEPSSQQLIVTDGTDDGHYIITYRCIWDAGTISGTVGEMGLYMKVGGHTTTWVFSGGDPTSVKMISRLACADSDFTPIVINTEYPFIIDWNIHFQI